MASVNVAGLNQFGRPVEITFERTPDGKLKVKIKVQTHTGPGVGGPTTPIESTHIWNIKASPDGSKIKTEDPEDPDGSYTEITVNSPEPPKQPSISINQKDKDGKQLPGGMTIEPISPEKEAELKGFFKPPAFPELQSAWVGPLGTGNDLVSMTAPPDSLYSVATLQRLAFTVGDVANSLLSRDKEWHRIEGGLTFLGFDPAIRTRLGVEVRDGIHVLVLSFEMREQSTVTAPTVRNAFIDPRRTESITELGQVLIQHTTEGQGRK